MGGYYDIVFLECLIVINYEVDSIGCFFTIAQTAGYFWKLYETRATTSGFTPRLNAYHAYDAVWALAFALNRTSTLVDQGDISVTGCVAEGSLVPLRKFNYSNALLGCVIKWSMEQTNFEGVTVSI